MSWRKYRIKKIMKKGYTDRFYPQRNYLLFPFFWKGFTKDYVREELRTYTSYDYSTDSDTNKDVIYFNRESECIKFLDHVFDYKRTPVKRVEVIKFRPKLTRQEKIDKIV